MIPDGEHTEIKFIIEAQFQPSFCGDGDERWIAFPAVYKTKDDAVETLKLVMSHGAARTLNAGMPTGMFRVVRIDTLTMRHLVACPGRVDPEFSAPEEPNA